MVSTSKEANGTGTECVCEGMGVEIRPEECLCRILNRGHCDLTAYQEEFKGGLYNQDTAAVC